MTPQELFPDGEIDARRVNSGKVEQSDVTPKECQAIRERFHGKTISREDRHDSEWAHSTLRQHLRGDCSHDVEPFIYTGGDGWVPQSELSYRDRGFLRFRRSQGDSIREIAARCGVSYDTIRRWMAKYDLE